MKLAEFLADYIDQDLPTGWEQIPHLKTIIQQGIEAFASIENVSVVVQDRSIAVPKEYYS